MRKALSRILLPRELRYATRGASLVVAVGVLAGAFWLSPLSPAAMDRAATLAASGQTDQAIDAYQRIADSHALRATRLDARWRAAWLASVDPDDPQRAVAMLRDYVQVAPDGVHAARASERLGTLYQLYLGDPVRAAEAWQQAAQAAPEHDRVGQWQLDAGLAYLDADLPDKARAMLEAASTTDQAVAAHLALGRLALSDQPSVAYDHYSSALHAATTDGDRSLARLGAATALEALDEVDQALAELEAGPEDDRVLQRRRARLQAREQR